MKDDRKSILLRLHVFGPFRLETVDGEDITPRSAKACGLFALLAAQPRKEHTRVWLQDKLWSDRGKDQAAASLRQALSQLRRDLGTLAEALVISRTRIGLRADRIEIVPRGESGPAHDYLEGIDIRDPEFESWLRQERAVHPVDRLTEDGGPCSSPGIVRPDTVRPVHLLSVTGTPGPESLLEGLFIDCLERSVSEALLADIYREPPANPTERQVIAQVQAYRAGDAKFGVRISVDQGRDRRSIWSGRRVVESTGAPPIEHIEVVSLVNEAVEAISDALALKARRMGPITDAAILARLAVRKIFTMQADEIIAADALLDQAFEYDPRAIFLAWKVQLRVIQRMERHIPEDRLDHGTLISLMRRALDLEPSNSMVLATAANAMVLIEGDITSGIELASRSISQNPANPFAWDCLSIGLLMDGKAEEAHRHQLRACALSAKSPIRHFWDMGACLTSVVTRRLDVAFQLAHSASVLVPDFHPPLRYMAALHAERGDEDRAAMLLSRLGELEPDFTLDRMIRDPSYPVAAMRRAGLLDNGQLRGLL